MRSPATRRVLLSAFGVLLPSLFSPGVVSGGSETVITVHDPEGKPLADATVRLASRESKTAPWKPVADGRTDAAGQVRLADLPSRPLRLEIAPRTPTELATHDEEAWTPVTATIALQRGYTIRGEVRDAGGAPVAGAFVGPTWAGKSERSPPLVLRDPVQTKADGTFELPAQPRRPVRVGLLSVKPEERDEAVATPEQPQVVLTVGKCRDTSGIAFEVEGGAKRTLHVWKESDAGRASRKTIDLDATGRAFQTLDAAEAYVVWIPPTGPDDELSFFARGVRATGEPLRVKLAEGLRIEGRLTSEGKTSLAEVSALGEYGILVPGRAAPDGTYEVRGLFEGTWKVKAKARGESTWLYATADAPAGSAADLALCPR